MASYCYALWSSLTSTTQQFMGHTSECTEEETDRAIQIKEIHDLIEEAAYRALAQTVVEQNIRADKITEEQSGVLLASIKCAAHREMFKGGGYISERSKLPLKQVQELIQSIGKIVHDRDTKLTDGRYALLTDLVMALDDHNTMVKEILLRSWFRCPQFKDPKHAHLEAIKEKVGFYATMDPQLSLNFKNALADRQAFWDRYFPGIREASESASSQFITTLEMRSCFTEIDISGDAIHITTPQKKYRLGLDCLDKKLTDILAPEDQNALFEPRTIHNVVRKSQKDNFPLLHNKDITAKEFFVTYFPELNLTHSLQKS